jgi:hypothetical protein
MYAEFISYGNNQQNATGQRQRCQDGDAALERMFGLQILYA